MQSSMDAQECSVVLTKMIERTSKEEAIEHHEHLSEAYYRHSIFHFLSCVEWDDNHVIRCSNYEGHFFFFPAKWGNQ